MKSFVCSRSGHLTFLWQHVSHVDALPRVYYFYLWYKARLNVHGSKQEYGTNYFEMYAPVACHLALNLTPIGSFHPQQVVHKTS
jgi:hypothetical protein